jgi:hypothetical protein
VAISGQPVISRETRRLLITIVVAVTALWVLARIRFQERPAASTPVPNVLAQLRPASSYADLARSIADIRPAVVAAVSRAAGGGAALRIREEAAITLQPGNGDVVLATDRATGLAIVRQPRGDIPGIMPWAPRLLDYPRYLVAADVTGDHVALRPVFIGGLFPVTSPLWSGEIWLLPAATPIAPGTFVFTTEGAFAGLAVSHEGRAAMVPASLLSRAVEQTEQSHNPGEIGITVQPLSSLLASATGASAGVVITGINLDSPAAGSLLATEVIEAIDGEEVHTIDHWRARAARATAGKTLTLRVRGTDGVRDVSLTPVAPVRAAEPADDPTLGLRLRSLPQIGVEVLSVQPRSRGARAGIQPGDRITVVGGHESPSPAQLTRAFASLPQGGTLLVAVTRGSERRVIAIEK